MPVFSIGFDASPVRAGASQAASSLDAVGNSADRAEKNVKSFSSTLKSAAQVALAAVGAYQGLSKIASFMSSGVEYNRQLENAKLGIAAVLSSTTELEDAQGRLLEGAKKFAAAQQMSAKMAKALDVASMQSPAEYTDLLAAFQTALAPATQLGLKWQDTLDITVAMSNTLAAMNIPMERLARETEAILTGKNISQSDVARRLGISKENIASWGKGAELMENFTKRFEQMQHAGIAVENTFEAISAYYKDNMQSLAAQIGTGYFDSLKNSMLEVADALFIINKETKEFQVTEKMQPLVDLLQDIASWTGEAFESSVKGIVGSLESLSSFVKDNREQIDSFAEAFGNALLPVTAALAGWLTATKTGTVGMLQSAAAIAFRKRINMEALVQASANAQVEHELAVAVLESAQAERTRVLATAAASTSLADKAAAARALIVVEEQVAVAELHVAETTAVMTAAQKEAAFASKALAFSLGDSLKKIRTGLLNMLGGPWGIALMATFTAVSMGVSYLMNRESEGERVSQQYAASLDAIAKGGDSAANALERMADEVENLGEKQARLQLVKTQQSLSKLHEELLDMREFTINKDGIVKNGPFDDAINKLATGTMKAKEFRDAVAQIGASTGRIDYAEKLIDFGVKWELQTTRLAYLEKYLGKFKAGGDQAITVVGKLNGKLMDMKEAAKHLSTINDLFAQLTSSAKEFAAYNLEKEFREMGEAIKAMAEKNPSGASEYGDKLSRLYAGAAASGASSMKDYAKERASLAEEIRKIEMGDAAYQKATQQEKVKTMIAGLEAEKTAAVAQVRNQELKLSVLANLTEDELELERIRLAAAKQDVAALEALIARVKSVSGKLFAGSGGGSSAASTLRSINDELAKLTMTEQEYAQLKLDTKYADLRKELGRTTPELEKLIRLEQLALDAGYTSGTEMADHIKEVAKAIDEMGLDAKERELRKFNEQMDKLKEAMSKGKETEFTKDELDTWIIQRQKEINSGKSSDQNAQILREFNKEMIGLINGETAAKKRAVEEQAQIYRDAGADRLQVELWLQENLMRVDDSFLAGAQRGFKDYIHEAANDAKLMESLITDAFQGMEDAFVKFVKTGKLSFRDMVDSIISDLARIAIRQTITGPLASALGGLFAKSSSGAWIGSDISGGYDWFSLSSAKLHSGGIVGQTAANHLVPAYAFADAPRYHRGGIAGLKSDELPTILRVGEEVLTENNPRHRKNLGSSPEQPPQVNIQIVDQRGANAPEVEVQQTPNAQGGFDYKLIIKTEQQRNFSSGAMDSIMRNRYGIRPQVVGR